MNIADDSIAEEGGSTTAMVSRDGDLSQPLIVNLTTSDEGKATVDSSLEILADESVAEFSISAVNDETVYSDVTVTITASASGHTNGSDSIVVLSDDVVRLTRDPAGDVLSLLRGPQTGATELTIGPAATIGAARPWYATFAQQGDYYTAGSAQSIQADDYIPVDVTKHYVLGGWAKSGDEYGQRFQAGNFAIVWRCGLRRR